MLDKEDTPTGKEQSESCLGGTLSAPHPALVCISSSALTLILTFKILTGAGAKSRLLIGNNFSNVPRLRHPRTLIFPVHRASVGFSMPVLVLTNVSGLWMITSSAGAALPSLTRQMPSATCSVQTHPPGPENSITVVKRVCAACWRSMFAATEALKKLRARCFSPGLAVGECHFIQ